MLDPLESLHVRIKRKKQTIFLLAYPSEKMVLVRQKVAKIIKKDIAHFRLLLGRIVMDDNITVKANRINNGDVLYLVCKIDGKDEWEQPDIESLSPDTPDPLKASTGPQEA